MKLGVFKAADGTDLSPTLPGVAQGSTRANKTAEWASRYLASTSGIDPAAARALFVTVVQKENPYHDAEGKFTSAENAVEPQFKTGAYGEIKVQTPGGKDIATWVQDGTDAGGNAVYSKMDANGEMGKEKISEEHVKSKYKGPEKAPTTEYHKDKSGFIYQQSGDITEKWEPTQDFDYNGKQLYLSTTTGEYRNEEDILGKNEYTSASTPYSGGKVAFSPTKNSGNVYDATGKKIGEFKWDGTTDEHGNKMYTGPGGVLATETKLKELYETPHKVKETAATTEPVQSSAPKTEAPEPKFSTKTGATGNVLIYNDQGKKVETWYIHPEKKGANGENLYWNNAHGGKGAAISHEEMKKVVAKDLKAKVSAEGAFTSASEPAKKDPKDTYVAPPPPTKYEPKEPPKDTGPQYKLDKTPTGNMAVIDKDEPGWPSEIWTPTPDKTASGETLYKKQYYSETKTEAQLLAHVEEQNKLAKFPAPDEFPAYTNESNPTGGKPYAAANKRLKAEYHQQWESFQAGERKELTAYTADSTRLNAIVTGTYNASYDAGGDQTDKYWKRAEKLDQVLNKTRVPQNIQTYRAMDVRSLDIDHHAFSKDPEKFRSEIESLVGKNFKDPAYGSTSVEYSVAKGFMRSERVMMHVKIPQGARGFYFGDDSNKTKYSHEAELLLPRNTVYKIHKVEWKNVGGQMEPVLHVEVISK